MLRVNQNSVEQAPATRARFVAPDFTSGAQDIGRGIEHLGAGVGDVAQAADKIGEKYDTAAVKQADAEDLTKIIEIKAKALSAKGFDAQTAIGEARSQIAAIRKDRLAGLHNQRQQRMYADVFDQRNLQVEESFASHSITQIAEAEKQSSLARADASADAAVDASASGFDTDAFKLNLNTALSETASVNAGMGADAIGRQQAKVKSQIYSRAISGMLSDPDQADHAKLALDAHAADILPEDEEKLRRQLNPILQENQTSADAGWAFTNAPAPGAPAQRDPLAPKPEGEDYYPTEGPDTPPRTAISTPVDKPVGQMRPVSPTDPLRGKGRLSNTAAQHRARGSGNALDIAAPAGTPIYPPMSGKVIKNWWSEEGGWSVLIQHPNGFVTGYAHMRGQSALHEGQEVDSDTVIGGVGQTGTKAHGTHVHYTVRQSQGGPKVDPQAVDWGDTVKPESVDWKEGPLTKYEADQNNLGRALSRLHDRATAENWSPQRYQRAVEKVRSISGVQEQLYNQQQDQQYTSALSSVVALGDKFTSVSQIPGFGLLDPQHQITLQNIAKSNSNALAAGPKANGERFLFLKGLALSPQTCDQFIHGVDLGNENITPGERSLLWGWQLKLQQEPHGPLDADLSKADYFTNRYMPLKTSSGHGFTPEKRQAFSDRFMEVVKARQTDKGKPLSDVEMDDIARGLTVQVVRPSSAGGNAQAFEVVGVGGKGGSVDIPTVFNTIRPEMRRELSATLRRQGKGDTPRNIVELYLQMVR